MPEGPRRVEVCLTSSDTPTFKEQTLGLHADRPSVGLCFSGGGARALSASMGYYRALTSLGLMDKVRVISAVSGGAWASFVYTYYRSGAEDDEQLLGPVTEPADLTMKGLRAPLPRSCMGWLMTQDIDWALISRLPDDPISEWWLRRIGGIVLQPFGLYDPDRPHTISLNAETVQDILDRQPEGSTLCAEDFYTARPERPFLVVNASLIAPSNLGTLGKESPVLYEYTPLYVGSPNPLKVTYEPREGESATVEVGGGYIEPFGVGGPGPATLPGSGIVELSPPTTPCTTEFMVGTSSAAPAGVLESLPVFKELDSLTPKAPYWPPRQGKVPPTQDWEIGDGGVLENYGLISMLLRGLKTIVVFVNTSTALDPDFDPSDPVLRQKSIDSGLPPLFGRADPSMGTATQNNQVFASADFAGVVRKLQAAKKSGEAVIAVSDLTTVRNRWWGVPAGQIVRVCWVYLDRSAVFEDSLKSRRVRWNIRSGNRKCLPCGPFKHFPHYNTIDQNGLELIELSSAQVKLLAELACWTVRSNRTLFESLMT